MDTKNPNKSFRSTPEYAEYQRENFWQSNEGKVPPFNTDPTKLEELAKERLSEGGWYYASSNAGYSTTHLANIWGHKTSAPIGFSPIGINKIYHKDGELPVTKVAKELNLPYCLSTAGSQPIEDVGKANGEGTRFFQLYMPHDDELTISLLQRAVDSGFTACILTVDTWQLGWRHDDVANSNYAFYHGTGADLGLSDPVFKKRLAADGIDPATMPNEAGAKWIDNVWHGRAHTREKIPWLIKTWKQLSGALGSELYIMYDSGVRGASDVFKALALGAQFVFVGRLWVWGLSIMGDHGVRHVMKSLLADFDILLNVAGYQNVQQIIGNRDAMESYEKSYTLLQERAKL
ncbi:hypothetical protein KVT40_007291 [Elsinoe batatas]|uniref:FMN hydroxy acid dehydrogenase domain-containing protein n=1 Tax=Elsinoe batatas TaxID=2601811 RepID=A0A8K0L146_9PEZI|nr:hypothetical protein KVT40_007291 [Elsinoe batatas]